MVQRILSFLITCMVVVQAAGCFSIPRREPLPPNLAGAAEPLGNPAFRMWGDEPPPGVEEWLELDASDVRQRYPALYGRPHNYLAISGGGANGAFGAGLLVGWTARGDRPEFTMVTGVSTGALMAPFVFLGPEYDPVLREMYTSITTRDILKKRNYFSRFFGDSAASSEPLEELLERTVDETVMEKIAAEGKRGRSLFVGTTHLDAGRPVIWDIVAIARSGHPDALSLIRQVLLASASIPGVFPPVLLEVETEGRTYDELHVDGGVTSQVFLYPTGIDWARVLEKLEVPSVPKVYVIRNSSLDPRWETTRNRALPIAGRSIAGLVRTQGIGDLNRIFILAKRDGLDYNLAFIPSDFDEPKEEMFDRSYMTSLFDLAYRLAKDGYPWSKAPPEIEGTID